MMKGCLGKASFPYAAWAQDGDTRRILFEQINHLFEFSISAMENLWGRWQN
jgi:hypothetical protein